MYLPHIRVINEFQEQLIDSRFYTQRPEYCHMVLTVLSIRQIQKFIQSDSISYKLQIRKYFTYLWRVGHGRGLQGGVSR